MFRITGAYIERVLSMCYKDEKNKLLQEKLEKTFEELKIPEFIQRYFIRLDSPVSKLNYWVTIRSMFEYMFEKKIIQKHSIAELDPEDLLLIESEDIKMFLTNLELAQGMNPTSVKIRKNMLSSFWNYLVSTNRCPVKENIVKDVTYKVDKITSAKSKMPSEEQLNMMEEKIKKKIDPVIRERNLTVFRVLKGTGIRESELAGLDLDDIYLHGDETDHRAYIKVLGKGRYRESEMRKVLLTESAVKEIVEWLKIRQTLEDIQDTAALLLNKNGKRLNEDNIKKIFKNYGDGITPHMMRHWYATVMGKTFGIAFAQEQLGHSSMTVTMINYTDGTYGVSLKGM